MVTNVLHVRRAFNNDDILVGVCWPDGNGGRFAQRVDGLQVGARALVLIALVDGDVVLQTKLFEQPYNALATGFVQPMRWMISRDYWDDDGAMRWSQAAVTRPLTNER